MKKWFCAATWALGSSEKGLYGDTGGHEGTRQQDLSRLKSSGPALLQFWLHQEPLGDGSSIEKGSKEMEFLNSFLMRGEGHELGSDCTQYMSLVCSLTTVKPIASKC